MFTQKISMDCTQEQYEKYLKDELLKMGYKEGRATFEEDDGTIVNNINGRIGHISSTKKSNSSNYDRLYLGSFNAPLFLALAAMTDKPEGNYGEYVIGLISGRFYRMGCNEWIQPEHTLIRKATKDEIMAKFGDVKIGEKIEYPLDVTCKTDDESYFYATEAQMISYLKSKGYKILKPKTWEEI